MNRRNFFSAIVGLGAVSTVKVSGSEQKQVRDGEPMVGIGSPASDFSRALGLDPRKTRSIHLNIDVDDVITADVRQYVTDKDMKRVLAVVDKKYVLCHKPGDDKLVALRSGKI